jgi:hypothetical protein
VYVKLYTANKRMMQIDLCKVVDLLTPIWIWMIYIYQTSISWRWCVFGICTCILHNICMLAYIHITHEAIIILDGILIGSLKLPPTPFQFIFSYNIISLVFTIGK